MCGIFDGILLGEEATEAATADNDRPIVAGKVTPHGVDILDDLVKGVGPGA